MTLLVGYVALSYSTMKFVSGWSLPQSVMSRSFNNSMYSTVLSLDSITVFVVFPFKLMPADYMTFSQNLDVIWINYPLFKFIYSNISVISSCFNCKIFLLCEDGSPKLLLAD